MSHHLKLTLIVALLIGLSIVPSCPVSAAPARTITSFDHDWRFLKADAKGAEKPDFADSDWRKLDVPHDWSIEGPFDKDNPTRGAGGFLPSGVGWYPNISLYRLTTKTGASSSSSMA